MNVTFTNAAFSSTSSIIISSSWILRGRISEISQLFRNVVLSETSLTTEVPVNPTAAITPIIPIIAIPTKIFGFTKMI